MVVFSGMCSLLLSFGNWMCISRLNVMIVFAFNVLFTRSILAYALSEGWGRLCFRAFI